MDGSGREVETGDLTSRLELPARGQILVYDALPLPFGLATNGVFTFEIDPTSKAIRRIWDSSSKLMWDRETAQMGSDFLKFVEERKVAEPTGPPPSRAGGAHSEAARPCGEPVIITPANMGEYDLGIAATFTPCTIKAGTEPERPTGMVIVKLVFGIQSKGIEKYDRAYLGIRGVVSARLFPAMREHSATILWVTFTVHESWLPKTVVLLEERPYGYDVGQCNIDVGAFWKVQAGKDAGRRGN